MENGIRFAKTTEELHASYQLRYKVYVEGMGRLKDKSDHIQKELKDSYDETARAVIAIKNNKAIGTLRLFWGGDASFSQTLIEAYHLSPFMNLLKEDQICIVERLMVDESHRGSTTTLRMYKEVMHFVLDHQVEAVFLDCEPHHLNSYLKLGFRPFTETYTYPGIGLVVPMVLITGDYQHLKKIGSPFAMLTREEDLSHCIHTKVLLDKIDHTSNIVSQVSSSHGEFLNKIYEDTKLLSNTKPKIFDDLEEDEIQRVIKKSHIIECSLGDHIIEWSNSAKTIFVLLSGIVEVKRGKELQAIISPGETIGEIAYFLKVPRSASIIAATNNVRVLSLDEASMSRLLKFDSLLANKILMNICKSLCFRIITDVETPEPKVS